MTVSPRALRPIALAAALLLAAGGCGIFPSGGNDISQGELLIELSETINELRAQDAMFQEELDSLRGLVARQDTVIARLANAAGVPLPRRMLLAVEYGYGFKARNTDGSEGTHVVKITGFKIF